MGSTGPNPPVYRYECLCSKSFKALAECCLLTQSGWLVTLARLLLMHNLTELLVYPTKKCCHGAAY